jgi:hypothetical protein
VAELSDAQRKRAEARQRRRSKAQPEPAEQADDGAASESSEGGEESHHTMKQAAKVAAASAAVGAAAAAARALKHHEDYEVDEQEPQDASDDVAAQAPDERETPSEPEEPARDQPQAEEPEPREPEARRDEEKQEPVDGAALGDARQVVERAREQLEALLERTVESVSSLERTHDGWVASLEVLELSRIPESTDVLASYEMELDEGLNLRRYQQVRRYHRAQAGHGEES